MCIKFVKLKVYCLIESVRRCIVASKLQMQSMEYFGVRANNADDVVVKKANEVIDTFAK